MFYPTSDLEELMPDLLIQEAYQGLGKPNDTPRYNTRSNSKLGRMVVEKTKETPQISLQKTVFQSPQNGKKGVLPTNVATHPVVEYSYKYGKVMLNGLDNSINTPRVFNGSWRP